MIASRRTAFLAASLVVLGTALQGCQELARLFGQGQGPDGLPAGLASDLMAIPGSDALPGLPAYWASAKPGSELVVASPKARPIRPAAASDAEASPSPSPTPSPTPSPVPSPAAVQAAQAPAPASPGPSLPPSPPPPPSRPPASPSPQPTATPSATPLHIESDTARYDRQTKIALASGNVVIRQEETTIRAEDAQYDENAKTSYVNDAVQVHQRDKKTRRDTRIAAYRLTAFHEEKRIIMEQDVRMEIDADPRPVPTYKAPAVSDAEKRRRVEEAVRRSRTIITSQEMEYWTRLKDATFAGNVEVIQPQKRALADRATMIDATGTITLEGKASLEQIRGDWLKGLGVLPKDKQDDEEFKRALENKATIEADVIVIDQNTNDVQAEGNVKITQKGRIAYADRATFTDASGLMHLTDSVRLLRENGDWMKADKAIFDTRSDRFEAIGTERQVETSFTVEDEEEAPPPAQPQPQPTQSLPALPRPRP